MRERLDSDIKASLLAGDKDKARALSFIKSSITQAEKDNKAGLTDEDVVNILRKETKKRIEAAELFEKGGNIESAKKERYEADLISQYLPAQMSESDLTTAISKIALSLGLPMEQSSMGRIIGEAKKELGSQADPSLIAKIVGNLIRGE